MGPSLRDRTGPPCSPARPGPCWEAGASLPPAVRASIRRFQAGEDGDSSALFDKADAAGAPEYAAALRLFVAEEKNHARLLALLREAGGATKQAGHWSDTAFA